MKAIKIFGYIILLFILFIIGFLFYMGGFSKIEISRGDFGPTEIIFSTHRGAYRNIGNSWNKFQKDLETANLKECDALAIYLDPPGTPEDQLRSILACKIDALPEESKLSLKTKFKSFTIIKSEAVLSKFPFKNYFSYMLGPMKVYPKFTQYLETEKIQPVVAYELYGVMDKTKEIEFVMPLGTTKEIYQSLYDAF